MTSTPSKATAGPWRAVKASHGPIDIFDSRDRDIVTVYGGGVEAGSKAANARLIAAAPDLLDALRNFTEGRDIAYTDALVVARAAISRATGGA